MMSPRLHAQLDFESTIRLSASPQRAAFLELVFDHFLRENAVIRHPDFLPPAAAAPQDVAWQRYVSPPAPVPPSTVTLIFTL